MMMIGREPGPLDAGQEYPLYLYVRYGTDGRFDVELRWRDARGPRTKTLSLAL
jgi:hypothetical protein